jgi:F-type H+-transporting ATPase subunit b
MHIDWWTLGLQTVNLLVLLWLLGRFLFRPMARIVADRQEAADRLLQDAEARKSEAEAAAKAARDEHEAAIAQRAAKLKEAQADAEAARTSLIEEAHRETRRMQDEAQAAMAHMRAEEEARTNRAANALAADIAARLLDRPAAQLPLTGFLAGFESALTSLPQDARARIGAQDKPIVIRVAHPPSESDLAALRASLSRALGRDVQFETKVDAALIGGLALETDMAAVDNSLRADLERVREGLNDDAAR